MTADTVEEAIAPMRQALQLDGADLEFDDERNGIADFRLILTDDTACKECVMPHDILEQVVFVNLSKAQPHITAVAIDDPRISDA